MSDPIEALILDLLESVAPRPRPYLEVMNAWRTSCPKLPVWEEAISRGLIERRSAPDGALVGLTRTGREFLGERRGAGAANPAADLASSSPGAGPMLIQYDLTRRSRPIVVIEHQPRWADEFAQIAQRIRLLLGAAALDTDVDHIGSTAVSGLAAKDVIDVQISVPELDRAADLLAPLFTHGFRQRGGFRHDLFFGMSETDPELRKLYLREPEGERRTHIHVRERGRFNQRYALLFRDYLRATPAACTAYEELKRRAAHLFPENIEGYLYIKEPVLHLIYDAASRWAAEVGWRSGTPATATR
jgi:GrpB-like predicted nucleotidyltransferase (UPF0157 family)